MDAFRKSLWEDRAVTTAEIESALGDLRKLTEGGIVGGVSGGRMKAYKESIFNAKTQSRKEKNLNLPGTARDLLSKSGRCSALAALR